MEKDTLPPTPKRYTYRTLDHDDSIRIFVLQPGKSYEPLVCSLIPARLSNMPYVEAISYTWGSPEKPFTIDCDGRILPITRNLRDSLRQVRSETTTRLLWADSICVHQEDLEEQGHQVALMGEIYGRAKKVLICVGPDPEHHAQAVLSLLDDVNALMDRSFANIDLSPDSFPWLDPNDPLMTDPRWHSFKELLAVPWSTRGWTIQEALLSATATVLWGETEISWEKLGRAHQWLLRRAQPITQAFGIRMSHLLWDDYKLRREVEARTLRHAAGYYTYSLLEIMSTARRMGVTDPRDRVYAFLGLRQAKPHKIREYMQISPERATFDYKLSPGQVYHKFAHGYLLNSSDLALLQYVEHTEDTLNNGIPSWVPLWDLYLCEFAIADTTWPILQPKEVGSIPVMKVHSDTEIQVRGVIFDKIMITSKPHPNEGMELELAVANVGEFWSDVLESNLPSAYPLSNRAKHLARTMRVGRIRGVREIWDQHEAAYMRMICGRVEKSHDERGYGIDVEALAGYGDPNFAHGACRERVHGRKIVYTERGYFGLAANTAREGDVLAIIFGTRTPFHLRKVQGSDKYKILGEAYVESKAGGLLGREDEDTFLGNKDWVHWGLEEQDIHLV